MRTASPLTISASTEVSAGISSSSASARSAARFARAHAPPPRLRHHVAVRVEDVVHDLEEQPELVARSRATGPARPRAGSAAQSGERDRRVEEAARLQPVHRLEVGAGLHRVEVLAADHPERRLGELAHDVGGRVRARRAGTPRRGARRRRAPPCPRRTAAQTLGLPRRSLVVVERGQVVVDEREVVHELDRERRRASPARAAPRAPRRRRARSPAGCACRPSRRARSAPTPAGRGARARARAARAPRRRAPSARQECASDSRFARSIASISSLAAASNSASRSTASSSDSQPSSFRRSSSSRSTCSSHVHARSLSGDRAEDAVHEPARVLGRVALRQRDRLVDRHLERDRTFFELVDADAEDVPLQRAELLRRPVAGDRPRSARRARPRAPRPPRPGSRANSSISPS